MNLHQVVRGTIQSVTRDQALTLYRATGKFARTDDLETIPEVLAGVVIKGQIQSISPDSVIQTEKTTQSAVVRRCYLFCDNDPASRPWTIWRPLGRAGDYLTDESGAQWYVDAVLEDFSIEGWASLQIILQQAPVTLSIKEDDSDSSC